MENKTKTGYSKMNNFSILLYLSEIVKTNIPAIKLKISYKLLIYLKLLNH